MAILRLILLFVVLNGYLIFEAKQSSVSFGISLSVRSRAFYYLIEKKEGRMSDNRTKEMKDPRSFEERVFMRFDAIDARLDRVEARLDSLEERVEKLEAKQYDTKPIWEKALAAILELATRFDEMNARLDRMEARLDRMEARLDGMDASIDETNVRLEQGLDQLRSEMNAGFANQQERTDHLIRGVNFKIEALSSNVLKLQADQVYFNTRLQDVEKTLKESET